MAEKTNRKKAQAPENWSLETSKDGTDLTFAIRGGHYYIFTILIGVACILFFGYWVLLFLKAWVIDREEILIAGVIFFLVMLGGFLFGVNTLDRMLYAKARYRLGEYRFFANYSSRFKRSTTEIERKQILEVLRLYTPPKTSKETGLYRTIVVYRMPNAERGEFALEGFSEEEAEWVGPMIAKWADVKMKRDFSAGYEEAEADKDAPDHMTEEDDK